MKEIPIRLFIFWSYVPEWWARAIVWITGRQLPDKSDAWAHMGIGYEYAGGRREYFEAIVDDGFVGPKPFQKLVNKTRSGRLTLEWLYFSPVDIEKIFNECQRWVGKKSYSKWQLVRMWFFERFGRWVGMHVRRTPDILVCSEADARLIGEQMFRHLWLMCFYELRDEIRTRYDEVNPNSAYRKRVADGAVFETIN